MSRARWGSLILVLAAGELTAVALDVARSRRQRFPAGWGCPVHPEVALHPAGGGFCFRCAQERKGVSA